MLSDHPRPWTEEPVLGGGFITDANGQKVLFVSSSALRAQIILWANAEEVQMRRGWTAKLRETRWVVVDCPWQVCNWLKRQSFTDPATALVEADKWLTEQEGKP